MKKAVIFDLDGTLINSLPDIARAMNQALIHAGLSPHPEEKYRYFVGDGVFNLAKRVAGDSQDKVPALLTFYMPYYAAHSRENSHVYAGIEAALRHLSDAGLSLCVFSNKDQTDVENVIAHYFAGTRFDVIRGRQDGFPIKPDPAGALMIAKALGVSAEECWYVGDTATDMHCGRNAGMETIGVEWGFRDRAELTSAGACHIVSSPSQMISLILGTAFY